MTTARELVRMMTATEQDRRTPAGGYIEQPIRWGRDFLSFGIHRPRLVGTHGFDPWPQPAATTLQWLTEGLSTLAVWYRDSGLGMTSEVTDHAVIYAHKSYAHRVLDLVLTSEQGDDALIMPLTLAVDKSLSRVNVHRTVRDRRATARREVHLLASVIEEILTTPQGVIA